MKRKPEQTKATKKNLIDAFWKCYENKNIEKISIGEITRIAGYNRGTFYEYFTDIYDVLSQIEDELVTAVSLDINTTFKNGLPENISDFSKIFASMIKKYDNKIFILLGPSGDPNFQTKLQKIFLTNFLNLAHIPNNIPHMDYVVTFVFSSIVSMLRYWYDKDKDISEETLIALVQKLIASGIMGYTNIPIFTI